MTHEPPTILGGVQQALFGVRIVESKHLPAGDMLRMADGTVLVGTRGPANEHELTVLEERHAARMIVRRGMADVLEWLGMDAELPLLADGKLPLHGQVRRPALKIRIGDGWQTITEARWEWPTYPEQHPCGHFAIRPGCGGCDPGAIEYVLDDAGRVVWTMYGPVGFSVPRPASWPERLETWQDDETSLGTPAPPPPAQPEYAFDEEW